MIDISDDVEIQRSQERVETFRKLERLRSYDADKKSNNPLLWWKVHAPELPQLARLARRVLCIPATSARGAFSLLLAR